MTLPLALYIISLVRKEREVGITEEILQKVDGWRFRDVSSLEDVMINIYNDNIGKFTPGYNYLLLISYSIEQGWIRTGGWHNSENGYHIKTGEIRDKQKPLDDRLSKLASSYNTRGTRQDY